jgi:vacuolar-type H+-ATPase subunit H
MKGGQRMSELSSISMQPLSQLQRDSEVPYDVRVAQAIDRVLEVERAAQSAIAECEKQGQELLEHARQQRRDILERARNRIVALHMRAARSFEQQVAQIREQHDRPVVGAFAQHAGHASLQAALGKLADHLIGIGDEEN